MRYLRFLLILMGLWIILADNIGGLVGIPALTPYAYGIMAACAALPILFPSADRGARFVTFSVAILLLFLLRAWRGYEGDEASLLVIAAEVAAIGLTILLASMLGAQINAIQQTFADLGMSKLQKHVPTFEAGQHLIYREIRWARRYQQPLAFLAIAINDQSIERLVDRNNQQDLAHRLVKEAQREIWRTYAQTQVAKLLVEQLGETTLVTQRRDYFVVILAEVNGEQCNAVVEQLKAISEAELEIRLDIGVAMFPNEAVTFEALLEYAERAMTGTIPDANPSLVFRVEAPKNSPATSGVSEIRKNDEITSPV